MTFKKVIFNREEFQQNHGGGGIFGLGIIYSLECVKWLAMTSSILHYEMISHTLFFKASFVGCDMQRLGGGSPRSSQGVRNSTDFNNQVFFAKK